MIRLATADDLIDINNIYNQAIDNKNATADLEHITLDSRKKWFDEHQNPKYPVFVYVIESKVVGWLSVSPYRKGRKALDLTVEVSYYVDNSYHRKGIGTQLMQFIIENRQIFGFKHIICILLEINSASIKLLEKFGFEKWATLPNIVDFGDFVCSHLYYGKSFN